MFGYKESKNEVIEPVCCIVVLEVQSSQRQRRVPYQMGWCQYKNMGTY